MNALAAIDPSSRRGDAPPTLLARDLIRRRPAEASTHWRLSTFSGRLGEVSGGHSCASLTLVFRLVLEAQKQGEPVVWITRRESTFFPPDVDAAGVDLAALVVVWVPDNRDAARATDHLLRSGAFGLVVLDLGADARMPIAVQTRLVGLARKHSTALVCITDPENHRLVRYGGREPSGRLGSLVSLRAETSRKKKAKRPAPRDLAGVSAGAPAPEGGSFPCEARILKDKRWGPGWTHTEVCRGPDGLR